MKTAIYIEDGIVQLVLTPENEFERNTLSAFQDKKLNTKIFGGSFYKCHGGWNRQAESDSSLIIRTNKEACND